MKVEKNADRVGKYVVVAERMQVLYSVLLSGAPMEKVLKVEYLKGDNPDLLVQTTILELPVEKRETRTWDLAAIVNGDFKGGKLEGLKEYAEEIFPDADKPVIAFRTAIIHESEYVFQLKPARTSRTATQVIHSQKRRLGD